MPVVHEPSLKLGQLGSYLASLLSKAPSRCSLLFGVEPMPGSSLCESRKAVLGLWAGGDPSVKPSAAHRESGGTLAWRAFTCLCPTPLAGPIGAKLPTNTFFKVAVCHVKISTNYGVLLYPISYGVARCGCLGPGAMAWLG